MSEDRFNMTGIKYEDLKKNLMLSVIDAASNKNLLSKAPHENILDMAVIYRIDLSDEISSGASAVVTNDMLKALGVSEEQLKADAMEMAPQTHALRIGTIESAIGIPEEPAEEGGSQMYVCTTETPFLGAAVIAYPDFMEQARETVGGDFYILPSSKHEVLIMPQLNVPSVAELKNMVKEINASEVEPEDRLTDNVYHYDSEEKLFEMADDFEARQAELEENKEIKAAAMQNPQRRQEQTQTKQSVLGNLQTKKDEIAKEAPSKHEQTKDRGREETL